MPKSSVNASLSSYDDIFSTEESRQEEQREQVQQIPIGELFPFKNHPFKVLDDDSMSDTVESVKQYGVLSPLIARPRPKGGYEIISGHRRQHAAELAGLETLPVIVRQMDDDAAIILMVDSNLQREHKLMGLPLNRALRDGSGEAYDVVAGTFLVVGLGEEDFASLSPELAQKYEEHFHQPEDFIQLGHRMMIVRVPDEAVSPEDSKTAPPKDAGHDR